MWRNYITTAWRNLLRNKLYTVINLVGFSLALASVFILLIYVSNEYNYDKSMPNYRNCYRILTNYKDNSFPTASTPYPLLEEIENNFPEVQKTAMFLNCPKLQVIKNRDHIYQDEIYSVNNTFFGIIGAKILEGNTNSPLQDSHSIVLSQKMARKYFGTDKALGETLDIQFKHYTQTLTVTAIMEDLPINLTYRAQAYTHMDVGLDLLMEGMVSYGGTPKRRDIQEKWNFFPTITALMELSKGSNPNELESKINDHLLKKRGEKYNFTHKLQSMADAHLQSNHLQNPHKPYGNKKLMLLLLTISILILVVASINYIILNTATSLKRTIELGLRKVIGATQSSVRKQLLIESVLLSFICFPLALTMAELALPHLNQTFGFEAVIHYGSNTLLMALFASITLFAGILSGTYLSVFMAKVAPIELLKSKNHNHKIHNTIRKGLIVIQLIIFIALINCSLLIQQQLNYINVKDLGYNKEALLIIPLRGTQMDGEYQWLKEQISKSSLINNVSGAMSCPPSSITMQMTIPNPSHQEEKVSLLFIVADENIIPTMGMRMKEGHDFTSQNAIEQTGIILNEAAVKVMNLDDPIGCETCLGPVIGIVKNFHPRGLTEHIPPTCIKKVKKDEINSQIKEVAVRTRPEALKATMNLISDIWEQKAPKEELQIVMPDERLKHIYQSELKFNKLFQTFTFMAILIASLGLFGFSLFMVGQRTQEIGIRKVMGADIREIIWQFCSEYIKIVVIGFIVAAPVSWYFMQKILNNYAYPAPINPWYFLIALLGASSIVLISIISNIWKAANTNPVESLKYE